MRSRARRWWAKAHPTVFVVVALALAGCWEEQAGILELGEPLSVAADWLDIFPEVPVGHPNLPRVREIFVDMREAVGVHADLLVLEMGRTPRALALPDETVLLSRSGLELCYEGVSEEVGDARLAFLLGHELTHVANDDFWHASAFATLQDVDDQDERLERLQELLVQDGRDRQVLELRADDAGILATIQAGYDPQPILAGDRSFFEEWTGGAEGALAYSDPSHPDATQRAQFLRKRLAKVVGEIDAFHQGVTAFREAEDLAAAAGGRGVLPDVEAKYREAIEHFEAFRRHFEGREVLSNLALAHLRLATGVLADCDGTLVNRYYLPTALDPVTLMERARLRGADEYSSPCFESEDYQRHMREATRLLEEAVERDAAYLPARLNAVAAYVLDEKPASAMLHAVEAAEIDGNDARAAAAPWVAWCAYHDAGNPVDPEQIAAELDDLHRKFPSDPGIAFNLAAFESYRGKLDEALPVWRDFLVLEPEGPWAEIAREWVGEEVMEGARVARR